MPHFVLYSSFLPGVEEPSYTAVLQYISEQKLEGEEAAEMMKIAGVLKHLGEGNPPNFSSHSINSIKYFLGKEISPIGRQMLQKKFKIAVNPPWNRLESGIGFCPIITEQDQRTNSCI